MKFPFFKKKKQSAEERAEMLYTVGLTLIANGEWDTAFNPIRQATELGHRGAMGQLAMMYIFGQGCEENRAKGIELLYKSVELGNTYSCFAFSVLYDHGIEQITADEAKEMCEIAANAGLQEAIERLEKGFDTEG
ncbi:MAG: tetratricopeptide repeat protein [Acutalibacteraceae bacterium]